MTPEPISLLMEALMRTLGRHSSQDYLRLALRQGGLSDAALLKPDHPDVYPVAWEEKGLSLMMQRLACGATDGASTWGLQSLTLDAQRWKGSWPMGLAPDTVTPQEFVDLLAPHGSEGLCLPHMACCDTKGFDGQRWATVAIFGGARGALQSLTMSRIEEWVGLSILPPW